MNAFNSYLHTEVNLAMVLGARIERWKVKRTSPFLAVGRCPVCGDSQVKKHKTRFFVYQKGDKLNVVCHNCELSSSLVTFLKNEHRDLYSSYIFERYKNQDTEPTIKTPVIKVSLDNQLELPLVADLPPEHIASKYVRMRKLPQYDFYYAHDFYQFASKYNTEIRSESTAECRLIIPFKDRSGRIYAFQGRDLTGRSSQKYITISIDESAPKIFGIDRLRVSEPIIVVEGPLDSLFIPNAVAAVNSGLSSLAAKFVQGINKNPSEIVIVHDNEPRNPSIVSQYAKSIEGGYGVVLWPPSCDGLKDINEMVLAGLDVAEIIKYNTKSGLSASIEFINWKKIDEQTKRYSGSKA